MKVIRERLVFALLLFLFIGCAGTNMKKYTWTAADKAAAVALIVAVAADTATTVHGLNSGFAEMNPMYGSSPTALTIIIPNALLTGIILWAAQWLNSDERKIMWVPTMFRGGAAIHNYRLIRDN